MSLSEIYLLAMLIIFAVPYLIWRLGRTEYYAPLVVVQIVCGILLGPGVLGAAYTDFYHYVFRPEVILALNGVAWWAVMLFVWIAGIELDLDDVFAHRFDTGVTAGLALGSPLAFGAVVAFGLTFYPGWVGESAVAWQFVLGVGMACAVTALPILILFMEKLEVFRQPLGQRILRYASLDDAAIWLVLAVILMDWERLGRQLGFLTLFLMAMLAVRWLMVRIPPTDRWYVGLIWLIACGLAADWAGLHFMVGAFLSGAVLKGEWFEQTALDRLRQHVLLVVMPVFFLSTGLRTDWQMGGGAVVVVAAGLLVASVAGKLLGLKLAGLLLGWREGEAEFIGWLLQTKALIMIIFANILLDRQIITDATFTALLLMAVGSTMLAVPMVTPKVARLREEAQTG